MTLLGDKYKGKPNRYLTGCVERVKRVIHKYEESLQNCQNECVDIGNEFIGYFTGEDPYTANFTGYNPMILHPPGPEGAPLSSCPCARLTMPKKWEPSAWQYNGQTGA